MKQIKDQIFNNFITLAIDQFGSHVCETYVSLLNKYEKIVLKNRLLSNGLYIMFISRYQ